MLLHREDDALHRHLQALGSCLNDPEIGLMGYQPVDLPLLQTVLFDDIVDECLERFHGHLEDLIALHLQGRGVLVRLRQLRDAARCVQKVAIVTVGAERRIHYAGIVGGSQNDRARTIAEQDAGLSIAPIYDARHRLRPDHERATRLSGPHELIRDAEAIDEPTARRFETEGRRTPNTELLLHEAGYVREDEIRSRRTDDY